MASIRDVYVCDDLPSDPSPSSWTSIFDQAISSIKVLAEHATATPDIYVELFTMLFPSRDSITI